MPGDAGRGRPEPVAPAFSVLEGDVVAAAQSLLGWRLNSEVGGIVTAIEITEVEAYRGADDPASHAFRGRTDRNAVMFGPPGFLYVYRSYGLHWCANVVAARAGIASAILMRGGDIVTGRAEIEARRGRADHLTDGPGKLCQALGISGDHYGIDLADPSSMVRLEPVTAPGSMSIVAGPRIGISKAVERPWRFRRAGE
ncbi:DNA-3-methyladenine glycosylase [bacterium]|nr:DNA-3-methyladenine glycosylase [bacterium]